MKSESRDQFVPAGMSWDEYSEARKVKADKIIKILERCFGELGPKSVLDLGCYNGDITRHLIHCFRRVVGVDNDSEIIEVAKRKLAGLNIEFIANQQRTLPFEDGSFDIVILNHVLYYVDDKEGLLQEINRVLAPAGGCYLAVNNRLYTSGRESSHSFFGRIASRVFRSGENLGDLLDFSGYVELLEDFDVVDMTFEILQHPAKYTDMIGWQKPLLTLLSWLPSAILRVIAKWSPTFVFVLKKRPMNAGRKIAANTSV